MLVSPIAVEGVELGHLRLLHGRVQLHDRHGVADLDAPVEDAADRDAAEIIVRIEVGDEQLQRRLGIAARRRHVLDHRIEQGTQVHARLVGVHARRPGPRVRVEDGEIELFDTRVEIDEQVVDFVEDLRRPRVGAVDLVDDDDRRQPPFQRLAKHEPRLRQRPLGRIHEQHDAVDHRERALHLAAEVGMAGRIDDVDQQVVVMDRRVLGENRDAALALELVAVHRALGDALVRAERAALVQERVHQRRLAVIDVRDDGDVAPKRIRDRRHLFSVLHPTTSNAERAEHAEKPSLDDPQPRQSV